MQSITIKEAQINTVSRNKYDQCRVSFLINREDYTDETWSKFTDMCSNKELCALMIGGSGYTEPDDRPKKLSSLDYYMRLYCNSQEMDYDLEKEKMYKRYDIRTRSQLTDEQLDRELKTYAAGLQYEN